MAKVLTSPPTRRQNNLPNSDGDGNHINNKILLSLPPNERQTVFENLEFVRLAPRQVLHEVGDSLRSGYFADTGMVSVLSVFSDGKQVEVGLVGKEGFVGLPMIVGFRTAATRAVVQIEGTAFRIDTDKLSAISAQCPTLMRKLQQSSQISTMEVTQIAACNRLHEVEERLARWLLMCSDRVGAKSLPLTQDLLGQMLGTRRSSVSIAAGILSRAGVITYTRGRVNIINRPRLETSACECYEIMQRQTKVWLRDQR
jgi:CRP-like cAMP-binding protein